MCPLIQLFVDCSPGKSATAPFSVHLKFLEVLFPVVGQMVCANSLVALNVSYIGLTVQILQPTNHVQVSNASLNEHNRTKEYSCTADVHLLSSKDVPWKPDIHCSTA
jgi:hypothetical protein